MWMRSCSKPMKTAQAGSSQPTCQGHPQRVSWAFCAARRAPAALPPLSP
jgi:hypothetical protein